MTRTMRKLILAGVLLVFVALLPQDVRAWGVCCQHCLNNLDSCYNNCGGDPTCEDNCETTYLGCARGCRFETCPV